MIGLIKALLLARASDIIIDFVSDLIRELAYKNDNSLNHNDAIEIRRKLNSRKSRRVDGPIKPV